MKPREGSKVLLLGATGSLDWHFDSAGRLIVEIPERLQSEQSRPCRLAYAFKMDLGAN